MQREVRERRIRAENSSEQLRAKSSFVWVHGHWNLGSPPPTVVQGQESPKYKRYYRNEHEDQDWHWDLQQELQTQRPLGTRQTVSEMETQEYVSQEEVAKSVANQKTQSLAQFLLTRPAVSRSSNFCFFFVVVVILTMMLEIWHCTWHLPVFRKPFTVLFLFFFTLDKQNMSVGLFVIPSVDSHGWVLLASVRNIPVRSK